MTSDSDYLVDRRRLRRKVTFWRVAAFGALAVGIVAAGLVWRSRGGLAPVPHIARVDVSGFITGDRRTLEMLKEIGKNAGTRGVLVTINSPGGTVSGSESLYDALRELSGKKPTVAVVSGMAASGGYIAAMGTERIVAQRTSIVGSVGVIFQVPNVVKLMDTVGVSMNTVKSAPLKASPNPFEPPTPASQAAIQSLVNDNFAWFRDLVGQRRGIEGPALASVSDGRIFTGHQAIDLKLVDELGNEETAIAWLQREKGIPADLRVREWKPRDDRALGLWTSLSAGARLAGFGDLAAGLSAIGRAAEQPALDGLLAVWHP